jgi:hypothetical protein
MKQSQEERRRIALAEQAKVREGERKRTKKKIITIVGECNDGAKKKTKHIYATRSQQKNPREWHRKRKLGEKW